jgi:hypothetical protein
VIGDGVPIDWSNTANLGNIDILYSSDGFATSDTIVSNQSYSSTSGSYLWTIPSNITPSDQVQIRVKQTGSTKTYGDSAVFSIHGSVTVSDPFDLSVGETEVITLTYSGNSSQMRLYYSTNNGGTYTPIIGGLVNVAAGSGTFNWTVPDAISTTVKIKALDVDAPSMFDESETFAISGSITLNPVTSVAVGVQKTLSWTKTGTLGNTKLEWSPEGTNTWSTIVESTTGSSYSWLVPETLNGSIDLRARSVLYPATLATATGITLSKLPFLLPHQATLSTTPKQSISSLHLMKLSQA